MYAMVCTRSDLSQAISMVSRYMHDPGQGHWEAVKWILRYIKDTINIVLIFKKDSTGKKECTRYVSITLETSTNASLQRNMCLHYSCTVGEVSL